MDITPQSKFKKRYIKDLIEHFNVEPYREEEQITYDKQGNETVKTVRVANDLPTLSGFAIKIGVHRETLLNWAERYPKFGHVYTMAKEYQEHILVTNGLHGIYHPSFSIFTAKNLISWADKQEIAHSGEINQMSDEQIESRLADLIRKAGITQTPE